MYAALQSQMGIGDELSPRILGLGLSLALRFEAIFRGRSSRSSNCDTEALHVDLEVSG